MKASFPSFRIKEMEMEFASLSELLIKWKYHLRLMMKSIETNRIRRVSSAESFGFVTGSSSSLIRMGNGHVPDSVAHVEWLGRVQLHRPVNANQIFMFQLMAQSNHFRSNSSDATPFPRSSLPRAHWTSQPLYLTAVSHPWIENEIGDRLMIKKKKRIKKFGLNQC